MNNLKIKSKTHDKSPIGVKGDRLKASVSEIALDDNVESVIPDEESNVAMKSTLNFAKKNPLMTTVVAGAAIYYVGPKRVLRLAKLGLSIGIMSTLLATLNTITKNDAKK